MNKLLPLLLLLLLVSGRPAASQNLVPNPSFEQYNACPNTGASIPFSPGYTSFPFLAGWVSPTSASPDYKHFCGIGLCAAPASTLNFQWPRTGSAYVGFYTNPGPGANIYREYVQCKLNQPLVAGHLYHVSFYCSPGEYPLNLATTAVSVDKIGAVFSNIQITQVNGLLSNTPAVASPAGAPITDTLNWTRVQGDFAAGGGEEWMTIGRFADAAPVVTAVVRQGSGMAVVSYFLVDDVAVHDLAYPDSTTSQSIVICGAGFPVLLQGQPGGDEYQWQNNATTSSFQATGPGTYWVRTWKDTLYCVDTFHISGISPQIMKLPADTAVCSGAPLTISANIPMSTYSWSTGATSSSITVQQTGQYILTATDSCGTQRDTVNVYYSPKLKLPSDTLICNNGQITVSANNNYPAYQWTTGANTKSITISQSGAYILTVTDACGPQKDTINVAVRPPVPSPVTRDTVLCKGVTAPKLKVTGDSIRWYVPPSNNGSFIQPVINTSAIGSQTLLVSQTIGGCESDRQAMNLEVISKPTPDLGRDTSVCDSTALLIGPSVASGTSILWNTGESFSPIVVRKPGYYRLVLTNVCGSVADDKWIHYSDCDSVQTPGGGLQAGCLYIPTAFTPNGDTRNDGFRVVSVCPLERFRLMIVNRLGQIVYESRDISKSWDGTFKGVPAAMDTYFYYLEFLPANTGNVVDRLKGDLLLVR